MTGIDLEDPKLKVERAKEHIREIDSRTKNFFDSNPQVVVSDFDPDGVHITIKVRLLVAVPKRIAIVVGEALYQLRSALDVLACCLARANGTPKPKGVYFPLAADQKEFETRHTQNKIKKLSPAARDRVKELQPYEKGYELLLTLNRLRNIDVHSKLVAIGSFAGPWSGSGRLKAGAGSVSIPAPTWAPLEEGIVLARGTGEFQTNINYTISTNIAFSGLPGFEGQPVISLLCEFADLVSLVIKKFE
jgi:hypothetical protein